jgi:retinoid hydroxylase
MSTTLPPGRFGLPAVGESLAFFTDPYHFVKRRYERYGPVFKTHLFGKKTAMLLGDTAQQLVLVSGQEYFANAAGYAVMKPFYGDALLLTDGSVHTQQRKLMVPAFHGRAMGPYLDIINRVADDHLRDWGTSGQRRLYPEMRTLAFTLASAILTGIEVGSERDHLLRLWRDFSQGNYGLVPLDIPLTKYGRALRARRELDTLLRQVIARQAQVETAAPTVLQLLLQARDDADQPMSEDRLLDQLRLLLFAGHDTTSGTLTWLIVELLRHPELLEEIRVEVHADERDAPLTLEDVQKKPLLDAAIRETLRLYPQTAVMARGVVKAFTVDDYDIPTGWNAMIVPIFTQRLADYFTAPETFDPCRFLPPRSEDQAHPYAWVGFGGGPHQCLGEGVAKLEIKAFLTLLLRRYDLHLIADQDLQPRYLPLSRPKSDVLFTYAER